MQDINCFAEFDRVRTTKDAVSTLVVRSYFIHIAKVTVHPPCVFGLLAMLGKIQGVAYVVLDFLRHSLEVSLGGPDPGNRLLVLIRQSMASLP